MLSKPGLHGSIALYFELDLYIIAAGTELYYNFCAFDSMAEIPQDMFDIQSIDLLLLLRLQLFTTNLLFL